MIDNAISAKRLLWLKTAFWLQAMILSACIVLIGYAFAVFLPKVHRAQVSYQQTIQLQKDQLTSQKEELIDRYLQSAALFYEQSPKDPTNNNNAITALKAALKLDPNNTTALNYEAKIVIANGESKDLNEALDILNKSNQIKLNQPALEQEGLIYCRAGQDQEAIDSFQKEFVIAGYRMKTLSQSTEFDKYCSKDVKSWLQSLQDTK